MKKRIKKYIKSLQNNKALLVVFGIFLLEIFLRFYQIDQKNPFGYDQVDNAWAAKNIIVNHWFPLVGMVAKGNSGIYIGPFYYYLISLFYLLTNLNPIVSGIIAGLTSIFTFWVLYVVTRKLVNKEVATITVFINTVLFLGITFDRVQWPVNFIPSVSLIIFYLLFKILMGDVKKLLLLAIVTGLAFSVHFTAIFFPLIIILSLPLFPRTKQTLKYVLLSLPLFLVWLIPNVIYQIQQSANSVVGSYLGTYFHGFHLRRVFQLTGDALIQFNPYLFFQYLIPLKFFILPIFFIVFLYKSISKPKLILTYLILLWFIVPWFIFATYSGEISDYYFSINRFIALIIVAYFFGRIWMIKNVIPKIVVIVVLLYVAMINLQTFLNYQDGGSLSAREPNVIKTINQGGQIGFTQGDPNSYLYYYFMRLRGKNVY